MCLKKVVVSREKAGKKRRAADVLILQFMLR